MSFWTRLFGERDCSRGHSAPRETVQDEEVGRLSVLGICPRCGEVVGAGLIGLDEMEWRGLKNPNCALAQRIRTKLGEDAAMAEARKEVNEIA